jgi:hypothetical protein
MVIPSRLHHIFENYEATVRHIVQTQERSDATLAEFELFCDTFGGHAYLCRFAACAHSTTGFRRSEERIVHEVGHNLTFCCTQEG